MKKTVHKCNEHRMYIIYKKNKPTHTHIHPHTIMNYQLTKFLLMKKKMNLTYKKKT